jgi:16S rRNA (uracil1498-N3)-methyltransferase
MSKVRVYIKPQEIGDSVVIGEKTVLHKMKDVCRLREGDPVFVFDGEGSEYLFVVSQVSKKQIVIKKKKRQIKESYPLKKIHLGFPLVKEDRVDYILQKATELGVSVLTPVICERSLRNKPSKNKVERWQRIILEAARQSLRLWVPQLTGIMNFQEAIKSSHQVKLAGSIDGVGVEKIVKKQWKEIFIMVGPEGDFSPSEFKELEVNNFQFIKLSPNLLRVETAAAFSVGLVKYFMNNEG